MWRHVSLSCVLACGGCWSDDPLIDGAFTPDQWSKLSLDYSLKRQGVNTTIPQEDALGQLGHELFWEERLSGDSKTSCITCHDPRPDVGWDIDTRFPNYISLGALAPSGRVKPTKHNTISVVNSVLKERLQGYPPDPFTWEGGAKLPDFVTQNDGSKKYEILKFPTAGSVLDLAVRVPMCGTRQRAADLVRTDPDYQMLYARAFNAPPPIRIGCGDEVSLCVDNPPSPTPCAADDTIMTNLEKAIEQYLKQLVSVDAPFDKYIDGDETAISDSAKRGFAVFVGRGGCIECHSGPLLTDLDYHNTGVPQTGEGVPGIDHGRMDVSGHSDDDGKWLTPSLRQIAQTGPYMHDGAFSSLSDVIDFYHHGGVDTGYSGTRDPRILPLDLTDGDTRDLEAFLRSLTGKQVPDASTKDIRPQTCIAMDGQPGKVCGDTCFDLATDPTHCGGCSNMCMTGAFCMGGVCTGTMCPPPMSACGNMCFDLRIDPMNCGSCGHTCFSYQTCNVGTCVP